MGTSKKSARVFLSFNQNDYERFEKTRKDLGLKPSAYVRYLMDSKELSTPVFIKYRELIDKMSSIDTSVRALVSTDELLDADRRELFTLLEDLNKSFQTIFNKD